MIVIVELLYKVLDLYVLAIIVRVILSWVQANPYNPIVEFICSITDPVLDSVRRHIPPLGMIDISPLLVILAIQMLKRLILYLLLGNTF